MRAPIIRVTTSAARLVFRAGGALLFAAALSRAAESPGAAARPRIVHARPGFGFQARLGEWNPLTLEIENPGPAVAALARVTLAGDVTGQTLSTARAFALPARSRIAVELPIFPDRRSHDEGRPVEYAMTSIGDGGAAVWSSLSVMGALSPEERPLILIAEAEPRSYTHLRRRLDREGEIVCQRAFVAPAALPRRAGLLAAADIVITGALGGRAPDAFQAEALRRWIAQGGVWVIVPRPGFHPEDYGPLEPLLPTAYGPPVRVESLPALDTESGAASPFRAPNGILARPLTLRAGRARLGPPESPLVAEREYGAGRVIALAFDLADEAFESWPGAAAFWSRHIPAPPAGARFAARRLGARDALPPLVQEMAGLNVLSAAGVRRYLIAVIALVMTPILVGRLLRHPAAGWAVARLLAIATGLVVMLRGRPMSEAASPQMIEIYEARGRSGQEGFAVQAALGLYAPAGGTFRVRGADAHTPPRPGLEYATPPERFEAEWRGGLEIPALAVRTRAVRALAVAGLAEGVAPTVTASFEGDGLRLRVKNSSPAPLEDAFARIGRLVAPLGDLAPGEERATPPIRPDTARAEMVFSARAVRGAGDLARARAFAALYPTLDSNADSLAALAALRARAGDAAAWDAPTLAYWSAEPRAPLAPSEPPAARIALGLVRVAAETRHGGADGRVRYPRGALPVRIERRSPALVAHPDGFYAGFQPETFTLVFSLPEDAPDLAAEELRVFRRVTPDDFEAIARLHPADGGPPRELPAGEVVAVERAADFYDAGARAVRLTAEVRRRPGAEGRALTRPWIVRDLDIELSGRVVAAAPPGGIRP